MNSLMRFSSTIELPQLLKDFLSRNQFVLFNNSLLTNYQIKVELRGSLIKLQNELLLRSVSIENLPSEIKTRLQITDEKKVHDIAQDIYNEFCGPVRWYFPQLGDRLKKIGFNLNATDLFPLAQPQTTGETAINEIMAQIGDLPKNVIEKVRKLVEFSIKNQQCDSEKIENDLRLSVSSGGIGLGDYNARTVVMALEDYLAVYAFSDIPDRTEWSAPKKELPPTLDPATIGKDILAPSEAIDLKVAASAAEEIAASPLSAQQKSLVEAVLTAESLEDRSVDIQRRWKKIVEARIGGARDAEKTRVLLETAESAGGLGLNTDESQRLTQLLEQTASGFEKKREEFSVIEKIAQVKQQSEGVLAGPEAADRAHQNELNTRFVSMFGKNAVEEMRVETHREIESPETAHPGERASSHVAPLSFARPAAPSQPITEKAPTQQPSMEPKYVPKVPDKLRALIDAENPIFPLKTPAAPVQKKSSDIRPGMKLVGPIDELRTMSMVDFRRLSPDVSVRIQKIRSRIEVIAQDGPHEKIRAIQAFEQSDPVRLYRDVLKRSLISQRSSDDLRAEDKKAGKDYLEEDEILALRQFLTQIRYSSM